MARPAFRLLWSVYLGMMLFTQVVGILLLPRANITDLMLLAVGWPYLAAVAGYTHQRRWLVRGVWVVLFFTAIAGLGYLVITLPPSLRVNTTVLSVLALCVPTLWANFAYAFRSPHLWQTGRGELD